MPIGGHKGVGLLDSQLIHGSISLGLQLNNPLGVNALASGFNCMLQCFMWPVVRLYEGCPYGWPAWGCVTPVHQGVVCCLGLSDLLA